MLVKVTRIIDAEFQRDAATFACFTAPWIYNEADLVYFQCTIRNSWGILHKSHILPSYILWNSMTRLVLCLFCSEITQFPLKYVLCSSFLVNNLQISSDKQPSLCFLSLFRVFSLKIGQFRILSNCSNLQTAWPILFIQNVFWFFSIFILYKVIQCTNFCN